MPDGIPARTPGAARPQASPTISFNPRPGAPREPRSEWDTTGLGNVASIKSLTVADGPGIRASVYVSGCKFACGGCFNETAWNPRAGRPWTPQDHDRVIELGTHPAYSGISLLGGEPFQNTAITVPLVAGFKASVHRRGIERTIWCWTGYTFEWLLEHGTPDQLTLLQDVDVLVDGPFLMGLKDTTLAFRGSSNQRLIDVPASIAAEQAVAAGVSW